MKRQFLAILVAAIVIIGLMAVLTVPKLHAVHYDNNLAFSASGGAADIQVFNFHAGTGFSIAFHAYQPNVNSILFSVQAPDGAYLVHNVNTTIYSYTFVASQAGSYALIFSDPYPAQGFTVAANMTAYESLLDQYQPMGCNQQVPLQQVPILSTQVCTT